MAVSSPSGFYHNLGATPTDGVDLQAAVDAVQASLATFNGSVTAAAASAASAASTLVAVNAAASTAQATITSTVATATSNIAALNTTGVASKDAAALSATGAATSATNAATSATGASTSAAAAAGSATSAGNSATNAATSATAASGSATASANSSATALTRMNTATTAATNAGTSATNAASSATAAGTSATNAATSATAAAANALIVTNAWRRLATTVVSSPAGAVTFVLPAGYTRYRLEFDGAKPSGNAAPFFRVGSDGGATYAAGVGAYDAPGIYVTSSVAYYNFGTGLGYLQVGPDTGTTWSTTGFIEFNPNGEGLFESNGVWVGGPARAFSKAAFGAIAGGTVNAVLFAFVSVNVTAGRFVLLGRV